MKRTLHLALFGIISLALSACNLGRSSAPESLAALPAVTLSIQAQNPSGIFAAGQVINYSYTVSNVGGTALAGPLAVGGAKTPVSCPNLNTVGNKDNNLDPGESIICTGSYTLTQADVTAGSVANSATASIGGSISTPATSVVNAPVNKVLTITKTANPTTYTQAGQQVTFSYVITNTGPTQLGPAQFTVSDDHIPTPIPCGAPDATMPPAGTLSCSAVYTISPTDVTVGSVTSSATASGPGVSTAQPASATLTLSGGGVPLPQGNPSGLTRGSTIQYKVVKGEWIIQIARCFGADATALARSNPQVIDPDEISPDEILTVPNIGSNGTIYGPPCITFHTVQAGDTWNSIAQKYNADVIVLQAANRTVSLTAGSSVRVPLNSAGGSPGTGATQIPTQNPTACNQAQMVQDVTIPDGTNFGPGAAFTKTWRLKNTGTCTWTSAYVMVFDHGTQMDAPATLPLTTVNVPPGSTVDVSAPMKAPGTPGTYQADFRLRSPDNIPFGIGSNGQGTFWVKIVVTGISAATLSLPQPTVATTPLVPSTGSSDVVVLLGKRISGGPEIQAFQAAYTNGPCLELTPGTGVLDCKSKTGESPFVRLVASNPADLVNSTIRDVRIFPNYTGNLPEGLTWATTRSAVEARLGLPVSDPLDNGNNTVDAEYKTASGAYRLWITFPSDQPAATATMRRVRIALP
jgi:LysM repeat protein